MDQPVVLCFAATTKVTNCAKSPCHARCVQQLCWNRSSSPWPFLGKDLSKGMARHTAHQLDDADYSEDEAVEHSRYVKQEAGPKRQRHNSGGAGMVLESLQREELEGYTRGRNPPSYRPAPAKAAPGVLLGGRTCVQCNATQTPQWREGPAGQCVMMTQLCSVRHCCWLFQIQRLGCCVAQPGWSHHANWLNEAGDQISNRASRSHL